MTNTMKPIRHNPNTDDCPCDLCEDIYDLQLQVDILDSYATELIQKGDRLFLALERTLRGRPLGIEIEKAMGDWKAGRREDTFGQ